MNSPYMTLHYWFFDIAALLSFHFILHYYLFFRKEIYFFEGLYFREHDIRMSIYVFWLRRDHHLSTKATVGEIRDHPKCVQLCTGKVGVTCYICMYTLTLSLFIFCLIMSCFICKYLTLPFFKKMGSSQTFIFL